MQICFVAGTKIHTAEGLKQIEDIVPRDLVLTRHENDVSAVPVYKPVLQTFVTKPNVLYHIAYRAETGQMETLVSTGGPPYYVIEKEDFVPGEELQPGDIFALADGSTAFVLSTETEQAAEGESFTTYNFEVEQHHTYFAGELGVWVHNVGDLICLRIQASLEAKMASGKSLDEVKATARKWINHLKEQGKLSEAEAKKHLDDIYKYLDDIYKKNAGCHC